MNTERKASIYRDLFKDRQIDQNGDSLITLIDGTYIVIQPARNPQVFVLLPKEVKYEEFTAPARAPRAWSPIPAWSV